MEVDTDADTTCHAVLPGDPHAPAGPSAATDGAIPAEQPVPAWHTGSTPIHSDPALERRDSVMQADRPPCRFAVCRRSLPNPEPQKCQSPPMRAGHEHPAEGREN